MTKSQHVSKQLARQASRAIAAYHLADATGAPTAPHTDRLAALGAEVSFHPCGTPEGAVFQLCAAWGGVRCAIERGDLPEDDERHLDRLFANVLRYIEDTGGVSAAAMGFAGFYFVEEAPVAANSNDRAAA